MNLGFYFMAPHHFVWNKMGRALARQQGESQGEGETDGRETDLGQGFQQPGLDREAYSVLAVWLPSPGSTAKRNVHR